jgi:DNA-binding MarR family transcriptional regulator
MNASSGATDPDSTTTNEDPDSNPLSGLPPSSKLVYKVLEYEGAMTQEEIAAESRLCPRTVRYAIGILEEETIVSSRRSLADARQSMYSLEA